MQNKIQKSLYLLTIILLKTTTSQRWGQKQQKYLPEKIAITDSEPETFGYPTSILLKSGLAKQYLINPNNKVKVLYYAYQKPNPRAGNPPSLRYLIFGINSAPKRFIGIKFEMRSWPKYKSKILEKVETTNLNLILRKFDVEKLDESFEYNYKGFSKFLFSDQDFKDVIEEFKKKGIDFSDDKLKNKIKNRLPAGFEDVDFSQYEDLEELPDEYKKLLPQNFNQSKVEELKNKYVTKDESGNVKVDTNEIKNLVKNNESLSNFNTDDLDSIDVSKIDLEKIDLNNLDKLDIQQFKNIKPATNVKNERNLVSNKKFDLSKLDTSKVKGLESLDLSKFDTSKVKGLESLDFNNLNKDSLKNLDLSKIDSKSINNLDFSKIDSNSIKDLDFSQIDSKALKNLDMSKLDPNLIKKLSPNQIKDAKKIMKKNNIPLPSMNPLSNPAGLLSLFTGVTNTNQEEQNREKVNQLLISNGIDPAGVNEQQMAQLMSTYSSGNMGNPQNSNKIQNNPIGGIFNGIFGQDMNQGWDNNSNNNVNDNTPYQYSNQNSYTNQNQYINQSNYSNQNQNLQNGYSSQDNWNQNGNQNGYVQDNWNQNGYVQNNFGNQNNYSNNYAQNNWNSNQRNDYFSGGFS